jgi:hypothetical protein
MNSSLLKKAIIFNFLFVISFTVIYFDAVNSIKVSLFYIFGLFTIILGWSLPTIKSSSKILKFEVKSTYVWILFIVYALIVSRLRGFSVSNLTEVFSDRNDFISSQEGNGIIFILFFEVFFGYWLACFFNKRISIPVFLLIILIFTILSFSRSYFFYTIIAIFVKSKFSLKSFLYLIILAVLSTSLLLLRFNTFDLGELINNEIFQELFTKYPFVGIARLELDESIDFTFYNYLSSFIMPYDIITLGVIENIFALEKGLLSYSRSVGNELGEFVSIKMLSRGTLDSFNAFGTILYPFKFMGMFSFLVLFINSFLNSLIFQLTYIKKNESYTILSFILCVGSLISLFNTLIIFGILLNFIFPIRYKHE